MRQNHIWCCKSLFHHFCCSFVAHLLLKNVEQQMSNKKLINENIGWEILIPAITVLGDEVVNKIGEGQGQEAE